MNKVFLYTDGAARGNPGPAGAGFAIVDEKGNVLFEGNFFIGTATNNQAEYTALQLGLEEAIKLKLSRLDLRLDSELVVRQIKGEYKIKNEGLKPFYKKVKTLLEKFESYSIEHVTRDKNKLADELANQAIDEAL